MNLTELDAETLRFLDQNDDLAADLSKKQVRLIDGTCGHHAGGLYVAGKYVAHVVLDGVEVYAKLHDTWGDPDDGKVIVHLYDTEGNDAKDVTLYFNDGSAAADLFLNDEALVAIWKATR
jgi:hypothetical protein